MREKFDGLDIGDRIDHLPRDRGPAAGAVLGQFAHPWHEPANEREIGEKPDQERCRHAAIDRDQEQHRAHQRGQREGHHVDEFHHHIGDGGRCLHLFLRDAPGEIIVEKRDRLAKRVPVQPRQHQHVDIGAHHQRRGRRGGREGQRAQQQEKRECRQQKRPFRLKQAVGLAGGGGVDDEAKNEGREHLGDAGKGRDQSGQRQHRPGPLQTPVEKRPQPVGWRAGGGAEGVDQVGKAAHSAASVPMKPPDCRAQNPA